MYNTLLRYGFSRGIHQFIINMRIFYNFFAFEKVNVNSVRMRLLYHIHLNLYVSQSL